MQMLLSFAVLLALSESSHGKPIFFLLSVNIEQNYISITEGGGGLKKLVKKPAVKPK